MTLSHTDAKDGAGMEQLKVFVISSDKDVRYRLKGILDASDIVIVGYGDIAPSAVQKAQGMQPDVTLVYYESATALDIAQRIYQSVPGCALVLLTDTLSVSLTREALNVGIRLLVSFEDDPAAILDSVRRAGALEQTRAGSTQNASSLKSRVISVYSGKGGTGKTTIAVNIATSLAKQGYKTAIIDLNLEYSCVALYLDMQAKDTIAELAQERGNLNMDILRGFTVQHYSGLTVLSGPNTPESGEYVESRHVESVLSVMRPFFDCIVLDLPANFSDTTITAIENSNKVLIVMQPDLASIKAAHMATTVLASLQMQEKIGYVYNKDSKAFLSIRDVQRVLGVSPGFVLPRDDKTADRCQCIGRPIVLEEPRTALGRQLRHTALEVIRQ